MTRHFTVSILAPLRCFFKLNSQVVLKIKNIEGIFDKFYHFDFISLWKRRSPLFLQLWIPSIQVCKDALMCQMLLLKKLTLWKKTHKNSTRKHPNPIRFGIQSFVKISSFLFYIFFGGGGVFVWYGSPLFIKSAGFCLPLYEYEELLFFALNKILNMQVPHLCLVHIMVAYFCPLHAKIMSTCNKHATYLSHHVT